ncbi:hypothetical protein DMB95_08970 [Campylobacter sp. MIT 12-8780]|uniref:YopX family protein n=1 Tax=unclassified Campylobacter TaxID=2593542 RepID=UPI00115E297D|nr:MULTISPECIES: YopX family protein [unclassified Campylobacter]NDJ27917.1 hypothetical protein [Campylobacter sp. MIT 19-121]TQR40151.1 hypothetical protein DMB95_08970 [Campylobacter sp. MIT 12-8780]
MKLQDFDFRVWDEDKKSFVKDAGFASLKNRTYPIQMLMQQLSYHFLENASALKIELWSGFTDKNGVKILENDIVKHKNGEIGQVFFRKGCFVVIYATYFNENLTEDELDSIAIYVKSTIRNGEKRLEVIGNIHENADLLKQG